MSGAGLRACRACVQNRAILPLRAVQSWAVPRRRGPHASKPDTSGARPAASMRAPECLCAIWPRVASAARGQGFQGSGAAPASYSGAAVGCAPRETPLQWSHPHPNPWPEFGPARLYPCSTATPCRALPGKSLRAAVVCALSTRSGGLRWGHARRRALFLSRAGQGSALQKFTC